MRDNQARLPTWDRHHELTVNGPVPRPRQVMPPRVRVDPRNRHHLARPQPRQVIVDPDEPRPVYQRQAPPSPVQPPPKDFGDKEEQEDVYDYYEELQDQAPQD